MTNKMKRSVPLQHGLMRFSLFLTPLLCLAYFQSAASLNFSLVQEKNVQTILSREQTIPLF